MKYTTLGTSGVKVSKACLGTMNFGAVTNEKDSNIIMDKALERGINFFDVADFYGSPAGKGITEEIVGNWFELGNRRESVVLTTKCYASMGNMKVNDRGLSAYHIRRACDDSLKRLKTDHIDVYMMHHYDRGFRYLPELSNISRTEEEKLVPNYNKSLAPSFDEIIDAMERLQYNDKITYIGSANYPAWAIAHFNGIAKKRNNKGIVVEQSLYNLSARAIESELIPACREIGVGLMTYSPLAGGLLSGVKLNDKEGRFNSEFKKPYIDRLMAYEKLCKEFGEKPADVSVAWVLNNEIVTSVILGPRTVEQLENSLYALDLKLPQDLINEIDKIWIGPKGEAPECYAW